jgi:hypothetical protein
MGNTRIIGVESCKYLTRVVVTTGNEERTSLELEQKMLNNPA